LFVSVKRSGDTPPVRREKHDKYLRIKNIPWKEFLPVFGRNSEWGFY
jgi:hypothetical protein